MKRIILSIILYLLCVTKVMGMEIVYPKEKVVKVNAKSTFFIGNSRPSEHLKINNSIVPVLQNGNFAYVVPLDYGDNIFKLETETDEMIYKIKREKFSNRTSNTLKDLKTSVYTVKTDEATLRKTPVDAGINRLSQLPYGTELIIDGEKGNFYRVKLSETESAWVLKNEVKNGETNEYKPAKIHQLRCRYDNEYEYYRFKISKRVPFTILNQNENIVLKFYNTEKPVKITLKSQLGFSYYYENNKFILKSRYKIPKKPTIVIDAGHGGQEFGAIGCNGDKEKDVNLKIAKHLKNELENDFKIIMTRERDIAISLKERVKIAKDNNAFMLISIHANALPDGENPNLRRGTSVYYYHKQAKPLAQIVLNEMTNYVKTQNDLVRQKSLALVRPTESISVLIETAYMINPYDNILLSDEIFLSRSAKAIANGIRNFVSSEK